MSTVAKRLRLRVLPALAAAVASLALATSAAQGATVEVRETLGEDNFTELSFQAAAGEDNRLTITFVKAEDGYLDLTVKDEGAALSVGAGCNGGGEPGQVAHCRMHEPSWQGRIYCGKLCEPTVFGTNWTTSMHVSLGDGANSFDGSAFSQQSPGVAMDVESGAGNDTIVLGAEDDEVDPGAGSDRIHTGLGDDRIEATAAPDGSDLYDLGPSTDDSTDTVSYQSRSVPVHLVASSAGAVGEGDVLVGRFHLYGGMGDDVLAGDAGAESLTGGPGNDALSASGAEGTELWGGSGDDTHVGGDGSDRIVGGRGDDVVHGQSGDDNISGGLGRDVLVGAFGFDRIFGGRGSDRLFSGRTPDEPAYGLPQSVDDGRDRVDCGPGRDVGAVNPWDRRFRCEKTHLLRR